MAYARLRPYSGLVLGRLLLLFTLVPLLELYLLLLVGELIGLWPTVAVVLATGGIGAWLAKSEGLRVLRRWQLALAEGRIPEEGVLDGMLVLVGGVLLVTPGVLTDALGLALLFPPSRRLMARVIRARVERRIQRGSVHVFTYSNRSGGFGRTVSGHGPGGRVIDVEGEEVGGERGEGPTERARLEQDADR